MFNFKKKKEYKPDMKGIEQPKILGYINPLWEIEVTWKGQTQIRMPFCNLVHTHLKDYGFEPDKKTFTPPTVILKIGPGQEIKLPLFIKCEPDFSRPMTAEYAEELGMVYKIGKDNE